MVVNIRVAPLSDNKEISFQLIELYHEPCSTHQMAKHRDVALNSYKLECECGLEIHIPAGSNAKEGFIKVAIGAPEARIEQGAFYSNRNVSYILLSGA